MSLPLRRHILAMALAVASIPLVPGGLYGFEEEYHSLKMIKQSYQLMIVTDATLRIDKASSGSVIEARRATGT